MAAGRRLRHPQLSPGPGHGWRLNRLIASGPFRVEISRIYRLEDVAQAHRDVMKHKTGKLALTVRS
jgi:NADPH:quinone reductase-like Zn-dependent oxidoreductase